VGYIRDKENCDNKHTQPPPEGGTAKTSWFVTLTTHQHRLPWHYDAVEAGLLVHFVAVDLARTLFRESV
jgi:hypothetical protein